MLLYLFLKVIRVLGIEVGVKYGEVELRWWVICYNVDMVELEGEEVSSRYVDKLLFKFKKINKGKIICFRFLI